MVTGKSALTLKHTQRELINTHTPPLLNTHPVFFLMKLSFNTRSRLYKLHTFEYYIFSVFIYMHDTIRFLDYLNKLF